MTGTSKATAPSKDRPLGTVLPHLRLDTHARLGHGLVYPTLFGSARRALCSKGSDVVRRVAAGVTPAAGESVRGRRCFTIRGVDQASNHCITELLVERTNESSAGSRSKYRAQFDAAACYCVRRGELRQSAERRFRADGAPEVSKPQAEAAWGVVDSPRLEAHRHQWSAKPDSRARKAGSGHHERP